MVPGANPERRSQVRFSANEKITLFFRDATSTAAELVDVSAFGFHVRYCASIFPPASLVRADQPQLKITIRAIWSRNGGTLIETGLVDEGYFLCGLRAGDHESFLALTNPYMPAVRARIRSIVRDRAESEDVLQETLLKALLHAGQYRPTQNFGAWLFQIATNEALKHLRKKRKYRETEFPSFADGTEPEIQFADHRLSPADLLERQEFQEALTRAANCLEESHRQVFLLRDLQGLALTEVAMRLGISAELASIRLHRAHLRLRNELEKSFFSRKARFYRLSGLAQNWPHQR
jgi:RNA polymerase sigma-70 factor (ECF subfamily)